MAAGILLFYSLFLISGSFSKEEKWPPEGVDLADDPSKWPGHMEYIGTKFPQKDVEFFKGFPSVDDFLNDYVIPNRPVLMKRAASKLMTFPSFDDEFLLALPYSYTTFVEAKSRSDDEMKANLTVRQFLKRYKKEDLYLDSSIPLLVKSQISLPRSLKCQSLLKELKRSNLLFRNGEWNDPLRSTDEHSIFCQIEGKTEYRLINSAVFRNRESILDLNNGTESGVNVQKVDFTKYPKLREVPHYYKVTADRSDCVFLPSKWLYQTSVGDRSVSVSITWNRKLVVPSKKACGDSEDNSLAQYSFPEDSLSDFTSFFLLGNLHNFVEDYIPRSNVALSYEEFEKNLRKDTDLKDLVKWDEECKERAREFFHQMDINQDGVVSPEDLDELTNDVDLEYLSGLLSDRWADFKDIVMDQKEEKRNKASLADIKKSLGHDYEKEIQNILEEGLNEIFRESNVPGKLSFSKTGKPVISLDNEKNEAKEENEVEEINAEEGEDEEMKKLKELEKKINEATRKNKDGVKTESNNIRKDEL